MTKVNIDIAQKQFADLIEDVALGNQVVIMKGSEAVAQILPVPKTKPKPIFGSAKGLIKISDDFDEPIDDFTEYMK